MTDEKNTVLFESENYMKSKVIDQCTKLLVKKEMH